MIHFWRLHKTHQDPILILNGSPIPVVEETKFLGIICSGIVNHSNTFRKDVLGLVNDEVTGVTMDSHNVDASTKSTPQVTLSSTAPAGTRDEQSFCNV